MELTYEEIMKQSTESAIDIIDSKKGIPGDLIFDDFSIETIRAINDVNFYNSFESVSAKNTSFKINMLNKICKDVREANYHPSVGNKSIENLIQAVEYQSHSYGILENQAGDNGFIRFVKIVFRAILYMFRFMIEIIRKIISFVSRTITFDKMKKEEMVRLEAFQRALTEVSKKGYLARKAKAGESYSQEDIFTDDDYADNFKPKFKDRNNIDKVLFDFFVETSADIASIKYNWESFSIRPDNLKQDETEIDNKFNLLFDILKRYQASNKSGQDMKLGERTESTITNTLSPEDIPTVDDKNWDFFERSDANVLYQLEDKLVNRYFSMNRLTVDNMKNIASIIFNAKTYINVIQIAKEQGNKFSSNLSEAVKRIDGYQKELEKFDFLNNPKSIETIKKCVNNIKRYVEVQQKVVKLVFEDMEKLLFIYSRVDNVWYKYNKKVGEDVMNADGTMQTSQNGVFPTFPQQASPSAVVV